MFIFSMQNVRLISKFTIILNQPTINTKGFKKLSIYKIQIKLFIFSKTKLIQNLLSMSQQLETKQADLVKVLERENVISYKKKPKPVKQLMKSQNNNEDEDTVSAQSLQSGVYSEDVSRLKGKVNPLPELGKEKKRFITKNLLAQQLKINNYQQKQVRQQQNLMLKQKNNFLSSENMKLKTKISNLEKQNLKMQKILEEQPLKPKTPGLANLAKDRFRPSGESLSMKMLIKSLKKELQDIKKQNTNIKSSIKFTTISELECERDAIMEETGRLRSLLEEEQTKRISLRINQQGMSNLQQRLSSLQDKNINLSRENNELKNKLKIFQESQNKIGKANESEKNLNKMLYNVRRLLKEKELEVEQLRQQMKTAGSIQSIGLNSQKGIINPALSSQPNNQRKSSVERQNPVIRNFDKRIVSKSAQKINPKINQKSPNEVKCQNCKKLQAEIQTLKKKLVEYESEFQFANPLVLPTQPVQRPKQQQVKSLTKFIEYRFKAHHLSLQESEKYLLNTQNLTQEELNKQITIEQFLQSIVTEPFVILNKRYIEVFLIQVFCIQDKKKSSAAKVKIDKSTKITKKKILENYKKLMPPYELMPQNKEEEMFLQIAELVTSYYQQILAAMSNRKNGEGTISQKDMTEFFTEIQLEKEYVEFIITQIILESIDLERLNYFAFFEIFYMPQEDSEAGQQGQAVKKIVPVDKKKRFEVDHVVKQEDEQYEQSRSYMDGSRQKTISKHGQSFNGNQNDNTDSNNQLYEDQEGSGSKNESKKKIQSEQKYEQQQYEVDQKKETKNETNKQPNPPKQSQNKVSVGEKQEQNKPKQIYSKTRKPQTKQKSKKEIKKNEKEESYAQQFEEQKIQQDEQEQEGGNIETHKSKKPQQLIQKPYQIEDIEDEYNQQFDN